ncbi:MAG: hypothetical protein R6X16_03565 [Anaerolineae bacterium]
MPERCRVVLYGDSLVLAGVGRSLESNPRFEVVTLDLSSEPDPLTLDALCPATLILDLSVVPAGLAFSLLEGRPDLLLIGLDPAGDQLVVLSGQQARQLTMSDLVRLIDRSLPVGPGEGTGESACHATIPLTQSPDLIAGSSSLG